MSEWRQPYVDVPTSSAQEAKELLRRSILASRKLRSERQRAQAADDIVRQALSIPSVAEAGHVALYTARSSEPGTQPLIAAFHDRGTEVLLPVLGDGLKRGWAAFHDFDDLQERSPGRPPEPGTPDLGAAAIDTVDIVLLPALAVDTSGVRLGHGGGWYDRALQMLTHQVPTFAIVFPEEIYDARSRPLPHESHDIPVDGVVTPEGWYPLPLRTRRAAAHRA